ncbi:MAG: polysaccharide biosynthesis C-terminal domain-containing protein, partial [Alicyclobacillus sp.]|nr:polysaccharide biosynthesis C-terminal domain-containing protein [Alicyclobacillus sp.]
GIYSAAYRVINIAFAPIMSLLSAVNARIYQLGENGIKNTTGVVWRLILICIFYGAIAAVGMIAAAPVLPFVLGRQYVESVPALRYLAVVPMIQGIEYLFADALTGSGHQGVRSVIQFVVALINGTLNLILIPLYSWRGAAAVTILTETMLAVAFYVAMLLVRRNEHVASGQSREYFTAPCPESGWQHE